MFYQEMTFSIKASDVPDVSRNPIYWNFLLSACAGDESVIVICLWTALEGKAVSVQFHHSLTVSDNRSFHCITRTDGNRELA